MSGESSEERQLPTAQKKKGDYELNLARRNQGVIQHNVPTLLSVLTQRQLAGRGGGRRAALADVGGYSSMSRAERRVFLELAHRLYPDLDASDLNAVADLHDATQVGMHRAIVQLGDRSDRLRQASGAARKAIGEFNLTWRFRDQ